MTTPSSTVWPTLRAHDARGLIRFLVDVLGFRDVAVYGDGEHVAHAQLAWPEGGGVMLGSASDSDSDPWPQQPGSAGCYVVTQDVDGVIERARAAGAEIIKEPVEPDYGGREGALRDPEGNLWSFGSYRGEPA